MTFETLSVRPEQLLLKCLSGSKAYNLQLPSSDTDLKGIFILPRWELYGLTYTPQVSNATNDEVYYEIGRFIGLLCENNPNILELLGSTGNTILYRHPLLSMIKPEAFLSKLCMQTFAGYARSQIKKATGLNKKISRPMEKARKTVLDFCYVVAGNGTVPATEWLQQQGFRQEECGLTQLSHFRDAYLLYHQKQLPEGSTLAGIISGSDANDVRVSSIPKGIDALAVMNFNKDGYSVYCREYLEYWEWVEKRNEARYTHTVALGKQYDTKNMMHTFRLLHMASEIALYKQIRVYRDDRDFLLSIRNGKFEYEELMEMADKKIDRIEQLYAKSDLPDAPDKDMAESILIQIRESFYAQK